MLLLSSMYGNYNENIIILMLWTRNGPFKFDPTKDKIFLDLIWNILKTINIKEHTKFSVLVLILSTW